MRQARQCEKGRGAVALMWAATAAGPAPLIFRGGGNVMTHARNGGR